MLDPQRGLHRAARDAAPVEITRWAAPRNLAKTDPAGDIGPGDERRSAFVAIAELTSRMATDNSAKSYTYADFRMDRTSKRGGVGAAFEAAADKVRFGRAASDGPAGCGAWPPVRWPDVAGW